MPLEMLLCSALEPHAGLDPAGEVGLLLPGHTFSDRRTLNIGGVEIELIEAHGETHDHLFVWLPQGRTIIAGDDFYWVFPNLISGASP
ncbi:hypothetical protein DFAR_790004 [Desulfarculales bacterium]